MTQPSSASMDLTALAEAAGIQVKWKNAQGQQKTVAPDVLRAMLAAMAIPAETDADIAASMAAMTAEASAPALRVGVVGEKMALSIAPGAYALNAEDGTRVSVVAQRSDDSHASIILPDAPGYYTLEADSGTVSIAISPRRAPSIDEILEQPGARIWGPVAQIYSLRHDAAAITGHGDFGALSALAAAAAKQGAHALAISPVHAMFPADPSRYSPYGPSSRLFLNTAFIDPAVAFDPEQIARVVDRLALRETLDALERDELIDWPEALSARQKIVRALYDDVFIAQGDTHPAYAAFERFVEDGGEALFFHACFDALHADFARHGQAAGGWRDWPDALRDPASEAVQSWAQAHSEEVRFHMFAQWLADTGLAQAQRIAKEAGMGVGLIADLAVGTDPNGSHAWSRQADLLQGLSSGAPPDIYNPLGQGWGITAFSPVSMRANGYAAFIEMLRAVLKHAGGIRIDHVIGLARTWLVPDGATPDKGAYLTYPLQDMLRLIALEAWRHQAIVIGENLGTVPEGFNDILADAGILGMNVLFFERGSAAPGGTPPFLPPEAWSRRSLSTSTTHDLPTCEGWWRARDLDWKVELNLLGPDESEPALRAQRQADKQALQAALFGEQHVPTPEGPAPVKAMLAFIARGPQPLVLIPLEDVLGLVEQPNIPGTIDEHPNWRRRLDPAITTLFEQTAARSHVAAIHTARSST